MLEAIISLGGIGLVAAVALGFAAKKFAVKVDPRELAILEVLPGVNCGACGYPGCSGYAKALAAGEATPDQCPPGGLEVAAKVANILGVAVVFREPEVAVVMCQGDHTSAKNRYRYLGLTDCVAAQKLAGGPKVCPSGCLGLGTCARACPFDAIEMTDLGLAVINREKCTGCRKCISVCPRQVIHMAPLKTTVHVLCNSHDKGAVVRKYCQIGCIGCHVCEKTVPDAYRIENFLAKVNYDNAEEAEVAVAKCPTHCIRDFVTGYPSGSSFPPAVVPVKSNAA
jgi:electron transport complex protein RnfB